MTLRRNSSNKPGCLLKWTRSKHVSLATSYTVALELAKSKKPFRDVSLVKKCAIEMA
jgi:hypothetical protein